MSTRSSPRVPAYRITLFYGPEYVDAPPKVVQCVFNVKKRSWKGGVQIVVDVDDLQFLRVRNALQFDEWLQDILTQLPEDCRAECTERANDLFAQHVCFMKLQQAIQQGIKQENAKVESDMLLQELEAVTNQEADYIKQQVLTELDVPEMLSQE